MIRLASRTALSLALALAALGPAAGCDKPDEPSCRAAIANMRQLMGTDNLSDNNKIEGEVRRCKGGSKKKAVQCAINAKTYEELRACGFTKLPATLSTAQTTTPTTGPAPVGSAATGSATAGSAAAGSAAAGSAAAGSAAAGAAGSAAAGSAATGSAAAGSAAK